MALPPSMERVVESLQGRATKATIEHRERTLAIPPGFIAEALESGGVVFIGFNLWSRSVHGWKAAAVGAVIGNKLSAVEGICGDSIVNAWTGLPVKHASFLDPTTVEAGKPYVLHSWHSSNAIDLAGIQTAPSVIELFKDDPEQAGIDVLNSPWLTLSRLGLKTMAEVSSEGYLSVALPQLDEILFSGV